MKFFKKLTIVFFSLLITSTCLSKNIQCAGIGRASLMQYQAEKLYKIITDFLEENKDTSPENFDKICRNLISQNIPEKNLLAEVDFEEKSKSGLILYRGFSKKGFAKNLKAGEVYIGSNTKNLFGMGIYTTDSLSTAKIYSNQKGTDSVVKMLLTTSDIKILENKYLEKLKRIICTKHSDEFGEFLKERRRSFINENPTNELFKSNKAAVFYNSGLLTKLLGYDCLHVSTLNYINEYLIVNTDNLSVLSK